MTQITLDIKDSMADQLQTTATKRNDSISSHIISIITEKLSEAEEKEKMKNYALEKTLGVFRDDPLSVPPDIPWEADAPRRFDLL